jgi:hypothetical protein
MNDKTARSNADLEKERRNAKLNVPALKLFLGEMLFGSAAKHRQMMKFSEYTN